MTGVVIMIGQEAFGGIGDSILGQLAVLGAAISYSFAGIYGRRFRILEIKPIVTATGQVTASSLILIPITLFYDHPFTLPMPGIEIWLAIVSLALFSTALAYILLFSHTLNCRSDECAPCYTTRTCKRNITWRSNSWRTT